MRRIRARVALLLFFAAGVSLVLLAVFDHPGVAYAVGLGDATIVWLVVTLVMQMSGTANMLVGADAEMWTAQELERLRRRGWRLVHGVPLEQGRGDVDHIVVGPAGVFTLETKWSSRGWRLGDKQTRRTLDKAALQASGSRRRLRSLVHTHVRDVDIVPAVVVWGACDLPEAHEHGGVPVMHGGQLRDWLLARPAGRLSPGEVTTLADALDEYAEVRRRLEESKLPRSRFVEVGLTGLVADVWIGLMGGFVGVVATSFVAVAALKLVDWPLAVLAAVAVAVGGLAIRRGPRTRLAGLGWAVGSGACLVSVAVSTAVIIWT